jgi:predicted amidophosphoribosyltransferase
MSDEMCPRCGVSLGPDAKFCSQCGLPLGDKPVRHEHDRLTWWERRPGWERALVIVIVAAVIVAVVYFIFQG